MEEFAEIQKKVKRCESNMVINGTWFMVFGLWSVLKIVITMIYTDGGVKQLFGDIEFESLFEEILVFLILFVFVIILLMIHVYIGMNAIAFGRGKKRRKIFLFVAAAFAVMTILGLPSYFRGWEAGHVIAMIDDTKIAAMLVDLALVYILVDMVVSAIRLVAYNKKLAEQEA